MATNGVRKCSICGAIMQFVGHIDGETMEELEEGFMGEATMGRLLTGDLQKYQCSKGHIETEVLVIEGTEKEPLSGIERFVRFASFAVVAVVVFLILARIVWYYTSSILTAGIAVAVVCVVTIFIIMIRSKPLL